ncbi:MAG TPA: transglycosylase SLT domain-containing protein [Acidimicrobiales bacterium]
MRRRLRAAAAVAVLVAVAVGGQAAAKPKKKAVVARTYTVAKGDTLSRIAARTGTTTTALAQANGIKDPNTVRIGTVLRLPGTAAAPAPVARNVRTKAATPKPPRKVSAKLPARLRQSPDRLALWGHFDAAARTYDVPADLLKAMTWQESGWQNDKVSSTRAVGIGQLMPDTVDFVNEVLLRRAARDPGIPEDNIAMSARFLRYLLDQNKGDVDKALASYYQGLASVRHQGPLPQTKAYVAAVVAQRRLFS